MTKAKKLYVVTAPDEIRGIHETWDACRSVVEGRKGARYQSVRSREEAEALLGGEEIAIEPGLYAFIDGNHHGGVGVVLVEVPGTGAARVVERARTVYEILGGLWSDFEIAAELRRIRQVLAELAALHDALATIEPGSSVTVVHDYTGTAEWIEKRWKIRDPAVYAVIESCRALIAGKNLAVRFRHQRGHQAAAGGRNPFALYNARADRLATEATLAPGT